MIFTFDDGRDEVQRLERGQVAVVVVGRHVDLVGLGEVRHFLRRREPLPADVHHDRVQRVALEVRPVLPHGLELLAPAERRARAGAELDQRIGILVVDSPSRTA
jgi:hypothetical protein